MNFTSKAKSGFIKLKKPIVTVMLLLCIVLTFAAPAFTDGYTVLKSPAITGSAAAIEDVDLLLVAASAFGEAKKAMNATDLDKQDTFVENTAKIIGDKWQNIGLLVGARDALSGSTWSVYQAPVTLSGEEVQTYGNDTITKAYEKYKAFGYAIQNLNNRAQKSQGASVSVEEGLDAMSEAAIKMGSFGVEFLREYNPGPVLISLYDIRNMSQYPDNKWIEIIRDHDPLYAFVDLMGSQVGGTGMSFFLLLNAVIAIIGFALSLILTLLGNRSIGDNVRKFLIRIVIGVMGIYLVGNLLSVGLEWTTATIGSVSNSGTSRYVEDNLNFYDWYLTGFQLPTDVVLEIDESGNFVLTREQIRKINEFTYNRLRGNATEANIRKQMETYSQSTNTGTASYITPVYTPYGSDEGEGWNTDMYYAYMGVYSQNIDLSSPDDFNVDTESPIYDKAYTFRRCRYTYMSTLNMESSGNGWAVRNYVNSDNYYGLNPISAFNLIRSDFSGNAITATSTVYPKIGYVAFDIAAPGTPSSSSSPNMNGLIRFIACFTLTMAAIKGFFTIITSGFAGLLIGGVKTSVGSTGGLGQAIGAVVALIGGIIGISLIMSITLSLLDVIYGIAKDLLGDVDVLESFLSPMLNVIRDIPWLGPTLASLFRDGASMILSLVLMFSFPKLGGIPITTFSQYMADIPSRMAEKAQMLEGMLLSGRGSAGGGLGGGRGSGQYGKRAQAAAGQAFSSGGRGAARVLGAGIAAAGSLAAAGASSLGRSLNKKADALEGKPENPGISGWDDLSPEEQAKAAKAASEIEDWNGMTDAERRDALDKAGVFDGDAKDSTGGNKENEETKEAEQQETQEASEETGGSGEPKQDETPVTPTKLEEPNVPRSTDNIQPASVATQDQQEQKEGGSGGSEGYQGPADGQGGEPPVEIPSDNTDSVDTSDEEHPDEIPTDPASLGQNDPVEAAPPAAEGERESDSLADGGTGDGDTTELNNNHEDGSPTTVNVTNDVKNKADNTANNESKSVSQDQLTVEESSLNAASTEQQAAIDAVTPGTPAASSLGSGSQGGDSSFAGEKGDLGTSSSDAAKGSGTPKSASTVQSKLNGVRKGGTGSSGTPGQNGANGQRQNSQSASVSADQTPAAKSKGGDAKSKYGKTLSQKEQKNVRALHAAGDALQMLGGNRTLGEGFRDAAGGLGAAFVEAAMPDEMQSFAQNLRMRRMERNQRTLIRQNRQLQRDSNKRGK